MLYVLPKAPDACPGLCAGDLAILNAPFRPQLDPLSQDDEFIFYAQLFGWGGSAPNFYPKLSAPSRRAIPTGQSAQNDVQNLITAFKGSKNPPVGGVPQVMAEAFIGLYQRAQAAYNNQLNAVPPPSSGPAGGDSGVDQPVAVEDQHAPAVPRHAAVGRRVRDEGPLGRRSSPP